MMCNFHVSTRLFFVARTCLIWDFVCLCKIWIIEPVLIVYGLFGGRYIDTWTVYFFPWRWKHLSIALLRPLIVQFCIKQVRSFCHCCSMNNTMNKWGLHAIFPQVFWLPCLPPFFCTLHWLYPSFWTCLFFSQKFNIPYSCSAL